MFFVYSQVVSLVTVSLVLEISKWFLSKAETLRVVKSGSQARGRNSCFPSGQPNGGPR